MHPQCTLSRSVQVSGVGLHDGELSHLSILPAPAGTGLVFTRADGASRIDLRAGPDTVIEGPLCTTIGTPEVRISTIEHLMAALWICGIDNAYILVSGDEVPALDGSALPFCRLIESGGRVTQAQPRRVLEILSPIHLRDGDREMSVDPAQCFSANVEITFDHPVIGTQNACLDGGRHQARRDLAGARTFCRSEDLTAMQRSGFALGGSAKNAIVFESDGSVGGAGLQWPDEPVKHKLLDMLGDLAVAGVEIKGAIRAHRPGHAMTARFIKHLMTRPDCWRMTTPA